MKRLKKLPTNKVDTLVCSNTSATSSTSGPTILAAVVVPENDNTIVATESGLKLFSS